MRIIFRWTEHNRYTVAALVGLLDHALDPEKFSVKRAASVEALEEECAHGGPAVAAWSFTSLHAAQAHEEIRRIRTLTGGNVRLICGGPHASACPDEVLAWGVDAVFVGEAEASLPRALVENRLGGIIDPEPFETLDAFPPFAASRGLFAPVELRRGCGCRCAFCQTPLLSPAIRERSVGAVVRAAEDLRQAGKTRIVFTAPDALAYGSRSGRPDPEALRSLLAPLRTMGMQITFGFFPSEISPRAVIASPDAVDVLREHVAHRQIVIGAQSASDDVLRIMRRPHSAADVETALQIVVSAGFSPVVDVLFCTPGESRGDRELTLDWMRSVRSRHGATFNLHHFTPLPGTALGDRRPEAIERDVLGHLRAFVADGSAVGHFTPAWLHSNAVECCG